MTKKSDAPAIRFKGFSDAWEKRKLGDMMNVTSVKRIHQSDWTDSGVRFLRARDIVAAAKNEEPDDYLYISKEKYEEYSTLSGKVGVSDLLVTGVGTIGVPYLVRNLEPLYFKDGNIIWFQNSDKIDSKFLFYSFSAEQIQGFINESAGIGTVGTYTIESGKKTPISLPNQIEQAKVGEFFQQLDNLITLHQRKFEKLTNVKKSMLEKMFPQNGSSYPEIRFKGFTDPWEQRKFSDVVATRRGLTYKPSDIRKNGVRVLRSSNIAEDSFVLSDEDVFVVREAVNIDCVRANDILITAANGSSRLVGKHTIISGIPEESAVHGGFMLLGTTKEPHFVNASMGSSWYRRFIELFVAGGNGAIGNLNKNDLDNQDIAIPSEKEQKKIGSFFRQLDNLITLHQRELEKLQNIKKSMLEKMFV